MSKDMKCPFCGQKLESLFVENRPVFACCNLNCKGYFMNALEELWQELIRTRKALEIAVDVLKEYSCKSGNWAYGYEFIDLDGNHTAGYKADTALEQITALEQKD